MKLIILLVCFLVSGNLMAQGLNYELSFNASYWQRTRGLIVSNQNTYFAQMSKPNFSSFSTSSSLIKISASGNIDWQKSIQGTNSGEIVDISEMRPADNDGVFLLGEVTPTCDVGGGGYTILQRYDSDGNRLWNLEWFSDGFYSKNASGTNKWSNPNADLLVNIWSTSKIYRISPFGTLLDSVEAPINELQHIYEFSPNNFIAYKADTVYVIDSTGIVLNSGFSTQVQGLFTINDTAYVLTTDSIFSLDANLNQLASNTFNNSGGYSDLQLTNNKIEFISRGSLGTTLLTLNSQLQLENVLVVNQVLSQTDFVSFNDDHCAISSNFALTAHSSIRHTDYARSSAVNAFVNWTDIEVIAIEPTVIDFDPVRVGSAWIWSDRVKIGARVTVRNNGPNPLTSFRLTRRYSQGIACNDFYYAKEFSNFNLGIGDTIQLDLGPVFEDYVFVDGIIGPLMFNLCVFSSHPNRKTDFVVGNDRFCQDVFIAALEPEPPAQDSTITSDTVVAPTLIKVVDVIGRETEIRHNTLQIYMYSDGSARKVFIVE